MISQVQHLFKKLIKKISVYNLVPTSSKIQSSEINTFLNKPSLHKIIKTKFILNLSGADAMPFFSITFDLAKKLDKDGFSICLRVS